jgi:hypothetical protein
MSWLSKGLKKVGSVVARAIPGGQALEAGLKTIGGGGSFGDNLKNTLVRDASIASLALGGGGGALGQVPAAGGWMGGLKKVGSAASGLQKLAQPVLGGLAMYEGYKNDKQAQKLNDEQLQLARQSYGERAPLRTLGRDLMLDQTPPDLSHIYANSSNPFSRRTG